MSALSAGPNNSVDPLPEMETVKQRNLYMLESGHNSDVQFIVGMEERQKELIKAHTFILSASPAFDAQFRFIKSNGQSKDEPIEVIDLTPSAFKAMLKFLYADEFFSAVNKWNVVDVHAAANKYIIPVLARKCVAYASDILDSETVLRYFKMAKLHEEKEMLKKCWDFIDVHIAKLVESDEFMIWDHADICELLDRNTLRVDELKLFQLLDRWAINQCSKLSEMMEEPNGEKKREIIGEALYKIHFSLIPQLEFINKIVPSQILRSEEILSIVLHTTKGTNAEVKALHPMSFPTDSRQQKKPTEIEIKKTNKKRYARCPKQLATKQWWQRPRQYATKQVNVRCFPSN